MTGPGPAWAMKAHNVHGRPADLTIRVDGTSALLSMPPPGTAALTAQELTRLIELLRAARDELFLRQP